MARPWCLVASGAAGKHEGLFDGQGKLPLRGDDVRGFASTVNRNAMHLLLETRLVVGLLHPSAVQAHPPENVSFYRWGSKPIKHGFRATRGCGTFTETPDWPTGEPDFDDPKISVNSRLLDGKNLVAGQNRLT